MAKRLTVPPMRGRLKGHIRTVDGKEFNLASNIVEVKAGDDVIPSFRVGAGGNITLHAEVAPRDSGSHPEGENREAG